MSLGYQTLFCFLMLPKTGWNTGSLKLVPKPEARDTHSHSQGCLLGTPAPAKASGPACPGEIQLHLCPCSFVSLIQILCPCFLTCSQGGSFSPFLPIMLVEFKTPASIGFPVPAKSSLGLTAAYNTFLNLLWSLDTLASLRFLEYVNPFRRPP